MSRIGTQPVPVPTGVTVEVGGGRTATVKGPGGTLTMEVRPEIDLEIDGAQVNVSTNGSGSAREARAFHGMTRALLNNMVVGVTKGFEKKLDIVGVGWNAAAQGNKLVLNIGFCHPVDIAVPTGITVETPRPTQIIIKGADKQAVGHLAAVVRAVRPPEPYKGKGIRYVDEYVRRKAGKSFGA
ncbi:MAG: 50S ribosomal protein L6 [Planctomycetota bacterium]|jgi:large subunit ribosomal protein L6|nr:50S ribosomal protein L6 [Planctomycetota bacterium]